ncbi:MAG: DUF1538 domain-containing protein [Bacillota bacterium]|nr:DUF1538 domain-containing protein [Bacillota bacterium]
MIFSLIFQDFSHVLIEVLMALSPVLVLFLLFILVFKMPRRMLLTLFKGVVFAFAGLALFLQGVKVGFMPVGMEMGSILGELDYRWILIPLGFILGFVATLAEPAVRILSSQVEKSSSGYIRRPVLTYTLCFAVGLFIALGMVRIVYGIPFYYIIIPGYLLAIILMFFSKRSFTAVAFDSGGVATGPMTVTFIMALAVGAADVIEGRDAVIDGFGLIALVALAPIILVMLLGFLYPEEDRDDDQGNDNSMDELKPDEEPDKDYPDNEKYSNDIKEVTEDGFEPET